MRRGAGVPLAFLRMDVMRQPGTAKPVWEPETEIRERQSPDRRFASRHSVEWRSRDRHTACVSATISLSSP